MTASQIKPLYQCRKQMKVKVVKWCWKKWNGPILMRIHAKQCEIMQKINKKAQTAKFTVFAREISSAVLKTWTTRKTKTWITQNFQILYHIQGTTMRKLTSWGFRKCGTFGVYDFLKGSYLLSKSSKFSLFFRLKRKCQKKMTRAQKKSIFNFLLRESSKLYLETSLRRIWRKNFFWASVIFFWHRLFLVTDPKFQSLLTLSSNNSR